MINALFHRGFRDPVQGSQVAFRCMLEAMGRPGTAVPLPAHVEAPPRMNPGIAIVALTLLDAEVSVWLDRSLNQDDVRCYLGLLTGVNFTSYKSQAGFALIADPASMPPLATFSAGTALAPEASTTLVLSVESLSTGPEISLRGPGIRNASKIAPSGLPNGFWPDWDQNTRHFPSGADLFLTDGKRLVGIPRTVRRH